MRWLWSLLLVCAGTATAAETIRVCYNYGCLAQAEVIYSNEQLAEVRAWLGGAQTAADERQKLSPVIGRLLGWAGQQTPISADRGGNWADAGAYGRMDCIDHSTTTTRLLRLLEARGWLRFHRVLEPEYRVRYLFQVHYSAQLEEVVATGPESGEASEPARYVVDSWFRDNGQPAVVMTLESWLAGGEERSEDKEDGVAAAASGSAQESNVEH